jgi:solute carrier family 38 (sodium-coupled neutral amino acid transporter), member 11
MVIICLTVLIQSFMVPREDRGSFSTPLLTINSGIFQAIGVISFAFVCHHNSLLIYGSLKTPTIDRFARVTHYSCLVSMIACLIMATAGFLTFGDKTLGNVLNNFPSDNTMVNIARLCFGLNMLTTLPLEAFVCREVMLNYFFPGEPFNMKWHLIFSSGLIVSAMTISLITCDLGAVFELVGATSACALAYILPPLCYIKLSSRSWKTYLAWATVVFGIIVMVISFVQSITKMVQGELLPLPLPLIFSTLANLYFQEAMAVGNACSRHLHVRSSIVLIAWSGAKVGHLFEHLDITSIILHPRARS